jgi:hypothetical protein
LTLTGQVKSVAFSPDSRTLAAAGAGGKRPPRKPFIELWDIITGRRLGKPLTGHTGTVVHSVAFSPVGNLLASAGSDNTIRLWNIDNSRSPKPLGPLPRGHVNQVLSVTFSPDGNFLASASAAHSIQLWDMRERQPIGPPLVRAASGSKTSVAFSPDGKTLAAGSKGGVIHLHDTDVKRWPERALSIANRNFSWEEWKEFFKDEEYRKTVPELPVHPSVVPAISAKLEDLKSAQLSGRELRSAYAKIVRLALDTDDAGVNDSVCWRGSIAGLASVVLPAGERAVKLAPENPSYRDTRGLARALTGNRRGAIEDFQFFVARRKPDAKGNKLVEQRRNWIAALKEGRNPFDRATLDAIRDQ